ncbi:MAG TPA: hypothetical protein VFF30_14495 [Nitrososphaerales archaeon]|nr:hypothetical protein [Nitrososphaerales archaeon]
MRGEDNRNAPVQKLLKEALDEDRTTIVTVKLLRNVISKETSSVAVQSLINKIIESVGDSSHLVHTAMLRIK